MFFSSLDEHVHTHHSTSPHSIPHHSRRTAQGSITQIPRHSRCTVQGSEGHARSDMAPDLPWVSCAQQDEEASQRWALWRRANSNCRPTTKHPTTTTTPYSPHSPALPISEQGSNALHVYCMCTAYILYMYCTCTVHVLHVYCKYTASVMLLHLAWWAR